MNISDQNILDVLKKYGVEGDAKNIDYLVESYKMSGVPRAKVIVKVEMDKDKSYIIKFSLEKEHPIRLIEAQSVFSECMRVNGINTAQRFKCNDLYCIPFDVKEGVYAVTVEEYLGEELKFINYNIVEEIAALMAKMHIISQQNNCHIHGNTIWDLFDKTTDISRGYKAFCQYRNDEKYDFSLFDNGLYEKIIKLYEKRLSRLKSIWGRLPKYATQGDYSINNLVNINGRVGGIFDYNVAGDEVLVSDMIIEGIFVSYEMDLSNHFTVEDKDEMFKLFIRRYMQSRKLNEYEVKAMNDLYAVVFPFWWTRIIFHKENSLQKYLEDNNVEKVNEFLHETYRLLNQNYFDEF